MVDGGRGSGLQAQLSGSSSQVKSFANTCHAQHAPQLKHQTAHDSRNLRWVAWDWLVTEAYLRVSSAKAHFVLCLLSSKLLWSASLYLSGDLALKRSGDFSWIICGLLFPDKKARKLREQFEAFFRANSVCWQGPRYKSAQQNRIKVKRCFTGLSGRDIFWGKWEWPKLLCWAGVSDIFEREKETNPHSCMQEGRLSSPFFDSTGSFEPLPMILTLAGSSRSLQHFCENLVWSLDNLEV